MACMFLPHGLSVPRPANLSAFPSSPSPSSFLNPLSYALPLPRARRCLAARSAAPVSCALRAVVFDCDGVILESEHLHSQAYNEAFAHFGVRCSDQPLNWGLEFYDEPQNQTGGGKPKMRWYFKEHGWPSSSIFEKPPESDEDRAKLIDTLQPFEAAVVFLPQTRPERLDRARENILNEKGKGPGTVNSRRHVGYFLQYFVFELIEGVEQDSRRLQAVLCFFSQVVEHDVVEICGPHEARDVPESDVSHAGDPVDRIIERPIVQEVFICYI